MQAPPHSQEKLTADRKALLINLNESIFGTFAEIGAGQEVARHFFHVGGAAGTVAKTMSAYDMTFSDAIYGKSGRYVSKERLLSMLNHEYLLLIERLSEKRGAQTNFFVFANTVVARSFKGSNECHGWLGIRFQTKPLGAPNDIIIHVRMWDRENVLQQQALGIIGVNLIYGAFFQRQEPEQFVCGLLDELSIQRIEVDMLEFNGPDLAHIDNRIVSLHLVEKGLTNAIMFSPKGEVLQPSEVFYKKPILVERGRFNPLTSLHQDMLKSARAQMSKIDSARKVDPVVFFEITLNNLLSGDVKDKGEILKRADAILNLGYTILISNYSEYYRLSAYFRRYTDEAICMVMGIKTLLQIFNEQFYDDLEGGMLEALGRLFRQEVKLFVYPMKREEYIEFLKQSNLSFPSHELPTKAPLPDLITVKEVLVPEEVRHLYQHLIEHKFIEPISAYLDQKLAKAS